MFSVTCALEVSEYEEKKKKRGRKPAHCRQRPSNQVGMPGIVKSYYDYDYVKHKGVP